MKNNIPNILDRRGLSISDLHRVIIQNGQSCSYPAVHALSRHNAGPIADRVQIGTLRKIARALDVSISDLIGEVEATEDIVAKPFAKPFLGLENESKMPE
jgi:hypothetical protein